MYRVPMPPVDPTREGTARRPTGLRVLVLTAAAVLSWLIVILLQLDLPRVRMRLSILAFPVLGLVWLVSAGLTVVAFYMLVGCFAARYVIACCVAILLVAGTTAAVVDWPSPALREAFDRADFGRAAALARGGGLGPALEDEYYGVELPPDLDHISANGKISLIGTNNGQPVLFVPAAMGFPDGAAGWAHVTGQPEPGLFLDGFGDRVDPRTSFGGGWWWVE